MKVIAVTVNWNRPRDTLECVESLLHQIPSVPEIIVVDNGSTDDSVEKLQNSGYSFSLIALKENLGFSQGYNLGIKHALSQGADAVLIINNDATLAPNALSTLSNYLKGDIGAIAPIIFYDADPEKIWAIGGKINPLLLEKKDTYSGKRLGSNLPPFIEQDFIPACILLIPRTTFQKVGFFDGNFYMYYEDLDFSNRIKKSGLNLLVITSAHAWHKAANSSGGIDSPNERYWMARSSIRYFVKHAHGAQFLFIIPFRLISAIRTTIKLLLSKKYQSINMYWRGILEGLKDIKR